MRFDVKALAMSCAILWGAAVLLVALVNLVHGAYGGHFLEFLSSWYPGYHATRTIAQVAMVTLYAVVDGLVGGAIFGWLYNSLAKGAERAGER